MSVLQQQVHNQKRNLEGHANIQVQILLTKVPYHNGHSASLVEDVTGRVGTHLQNASSGQDYQEDSDGIEKALRHGFSKHKENEL